MGLFEYVFVNDPRFVCSEGHFLGDAEFQSKDFGCVMGDVSIDDGRLSYRDRGLGMPAPDSNEAEIYATCTRCPAFVQDGTGNTCGCPVSFRIWIEDDCIVSIKRTSPDTATWLETEPKRAWMKDCEGPMPYQAARDLHVRYDELRPERKALHRERMARWRARDFKGTWND